MQLYTLAHVVQVFILGFLGGFFAGGLLVSKLKRQRAAEKKISLKLIKTKNTQCGNTEYPIVSCKNY